MQDKIMIVDDAAFMRTMIRRILSGNGYIEILEAENGKKACELFEKEKPSVVILDISMPKMNGIDALKEMRKIDPSAYIIMCSAIGQEQQIIEAIRLGANDFIVKPFKPEQIMQAIEKRNLK